HDRDDGAERLLEPRGPERHSTAETPARLHHPELPWQALVRADHGRRPRAMDGPLVECDRPLRHERDPSLPDRRLGPRRRHLESLECAAPDFRNADCRPADALPPVSPRPLHPSATSPSVQDVTATFTRYAISGSVETEEFAPDPLLSWGLLTINATAPIGTSVTAAYSSDNGTSWLPTSSGQDLSAALVRGIRLEITLATNDTL